MDERTIGKMIGLTVVGLLALPVVANAALLAQYTEFSNLDADFEATDVVASDLSGNANGTTSTASDSDSSALSFLNVGSTETFTVSTPDALKLLLLDDTDTLTMDINRQAGDNDAGVIVRYSFDGGTTFATAGTVAGTTQGSYVSVGFDIPDETLAGTDDILIEIFGGETTKPDQSRLVYVDNIRLNGSVVPIPEPASLALLGLGGLVIMRRK